jgi:hypothetical protein
VPLVGAFYALFNNVLDQLLQRRHLRRQRPASSPRSGR